MFQFNHRGKVLAASSFIFLISVYVLYRAIGAEPSVAIKDSTLKEDLRSVQVKTFLATSHSIELELFGTVEASRQLTLRAPFAAKVSKLNGFERGVFIPSGEPLMVLDTLSLDFSIEALKIEQREMEIKKEQQEQQLDSLKGRYALMEESVNIYTASLDVHQEKHLNMQKLFDKSQALYDAGTFSEAKFLEKEVQYQQSLLEWDEVRKAYLAQMIAFNQLGDSLSRLESSLKSLELLDLQLSLKLAERMHERNKAVLWVDFPARVGLISVNEGDDVLAGQELIRVISADECIVNLNLPDHYLHWVHKENLINQSFPRPIDQPKVEIIEMAGNRGRVFTGAYLKSIAESLNEPSRSLPLTVARAQSLDGLGDVLIPGSFVKVKLEISYVDGVYALPSEALQEGNRIYYLAKTEKKDASEEDFEETYVLHILEPEILHRKAGNVLVRLPDGLSEIDVVVHRLKNVYEEMPVRVGESI